MSVAQVTSSFVLDLKTLLILACVPPITDGRNTFRLPRGGTTSGPEMYKRLRFTHRGDKRLLTPLLLCLPWWRAVGFSFKVGRSPPELEVILLEHLVMTQAAYQIHITCDSLS